MHPMLARLCSARALFAFQKGDLETAERHYADCVNRFPTEHVAVTEAMAFYDRTRRPERATEILERAAKESESGLFRTMVPGIVAGRKVLLHLVFGTKLLTDVGNNFSLRCLRIVSAIPEKKHI